ncbi:MAG: hypothetical protein JWN69_238 [Alphaproteobacteria bacterium]|nr:hypothetical protein [Alphaproteobacteria bacterium]
MKSSLDTTDPRVARPAADRRHIHSAPASGFEHHLIETSSASERRPDPVMTKVRSWRGMATVAVILVTTLLILKLGIWYFVGLVAVYLALDVAQRFEARREARNSAVISAARERATETIMFSGPRWHCARAARVAHQCGWIAQPMRRGRLWRASIRLCHARRATPAAELLEALRNAKLATRIALAVALPATAAGLARQSFRDRDL